MFGVSGINQLPWSGSCGGFHFSSSQSPPRIHSPLGRVAGALADAAREFLRRIGVLELHVVELQAAVEEMHVRVVEAGEHEVLAGVDHARVGAAPLVNVGGGADGDDAVADHRQGFGARARFVHGVELAVGDDEVGGGAGLGRQSRQSSNASAKSWPELHSRAALQSCRLGEPTSTAHGFHRMPSFSLVRSTSKKVLRMRSKVAW